jgi:hypothetical protein
MIRYLTIGKFISRRSREVYLVKQNLETGEISCNCKGWIYHKNCKHISYIKEQNFFVELTDIPTHNEAIRMDWGRNLEEKEKWTLGHLKPIVL